MKTKSFFSFNSYFLQIVIFLCMYFSSKIPLLTLYGSAKALSLFVIIFPIFGSSFLSSAILYLIFTFKSFFFGVFRIPTILTFLYQCFVDRRSPPAIFLFSGNIFILGSLFFLFFIGVKGIIYTLPWFLMGCINFIFLRFRVFSLKKRIMLSAFNLTWINHMIGTCVYIVMGMGLEAKGYQAIFLQVLAERFVITFFAAMIFWSFYSFASSSKLYQFFHHIPYKR